MNVLKSVVFAVYAFIVSIMRLVCDSVFVQT